MLKIHANLSLIISIDKAFLLPHLHANLVIISEN